MNLSTTINDLSGIAVINNQLATMNLAIADTIVDKIKHKTHMNQAILHAEESYEIGAKLKATPLINKSSQILMVAYENAGNLKKAIEFANIFIETKDSLYNKEKRDIIHEKEIIYQVNKKEGQIIFGLDNVILSLRKIFEREVVPNTYFKSVRGVGYKLTI